MKMLRTSSVVADLTLGALKAMASHLWEEHILLQYGLARAPSWTYRALSD